MEGEEGKRRKEGRPVLLHSEDLHPLVTQSPHRCLLQQKALLDQLQADGQLCQQRVQ